MPEDCCTNPLSAAVVVSQAVLVAAVRRRSTAAAADAPQPLRDDLQGGGPVKPFSEVPGPRPLPGVGNIWRFIPGIGRSRILSARASFVPPRKAYLLILPLGTYAFHGGSNAIMLLHAHVKMGLEWTSPETETARETSPLPKPVLVFRPLLLALSLSARRTRATCSRLANKAVCAT